MQWWHWPTVRRRSILRTTEAIAEHRPAVSIAAQIAAGGSVPYGRFLAWRNMVTVEPPNRPAPARPVVIGRQPPDRLEVRVHRLP